jgi:hypothetical protein
MYVAGVHVDVEAVRDFVGRRDLGAETIGLKKESVSWLLYQALPSSGYDCGSYGELLGLVVGGDDVTDSHDGLQVLVGLARWVAVVKRLGVLRVAVGGGEVDGKRQAQLASTGDVLEEPANEYHCAGSTSVLCPRSSGPQCCGARKSSESCGHEMRTSGRGGRRPGGH